MTFGSVSALLLCMIGIALLPSGSAFIPISILPKCDPNVIAAIKTTSWDKYGKLQNITATAADKKTFVEAMTSGQIPKFVDGISYILHPTGGSQSTGYAQLTVFKHTLPFNITIDNITEKEGDLWVKQTTSRVIPAYYGGSAIVGNLFCLYCCNYGKNAKSGAPVFQIDHTKKYNKTDFEICESIIKQLNGTSLDYYGYTLNDETSTSNYSGKNKIIERFISSIKNLFGIGK